VGLAANNSVDLSGGYIQWVEFAIWGLADEVVIVWAASSIHTFGASPWKDGP
jgi:hypothetical protein